MALFLFLRYDLTVYPRMRYDLTVYPRLASEFIALSCFSLPSAEILGMFYPFSV